MRQGPIWKLEDPEVLRKWPSVNGLLLERTGGEPNYAFHALGLLTLIGRRAEYTLGNGRLLVALEAANPAYETRIFGPDRVSVQGKLVGLIRRYH